MSDSHGTVYFNHGKESGPWGSKIKALAEVARLKGLAVESIDYQDLPDAGPRVERLVRSRAGQARGLILVGSSMGGYVATVASPVLKPEGLFLMAPAFYMPGYPEQNPVPNAQTVSVVHGWSDDVIPVEHSIRFAQKFSTTTHLKLHLIEDDHRFSAQLPFLALLFGPIGEDRIHHQRALDRGEAPHARIASLQLLHHQTVLDVVHPGAAVASEIGAEETHFAHFSRQAGG